MRLGAAADECAHRGEGVTGDAAGPDQFPERLFHRLATTTRLSRALDSTDALEVRKQAVFAITQLKDHQSVPLLMRIAREPRDREIRQQALFWLGQSTDPRAIDFFAKILGQ